MEALLKDSENVLNACWFDLWAVFSSAVALVSALKEVTGNNKGK